MFDFPVSWHQAIVITVIIALAVAAPSAPGFIGVFQIACVAAFLLLGLSKELATSYSIIAHAQMFIIVICYGIYLLFKYKLNLTDLRENSDV